MAIQVRISNRYTHIGFARPPHESAANATYTFMDLAGSWEYQAYGTYTVAKANAIHNYRQTFDTNFGQINCVKAERPPYFKG